MQIFLLSENFSSCAKCLCDLRLNKILVESVQIISTALWINNCNVAESMYSKGHIYLPAYEKHPICQWASENSVHYMTVIKYASHLDFEYHHRFEKEHASSGVLDRLSTDEVFFKILDKYPERDFPNCTTHMKHIKDVHRAYRQELVFKWQRDKRVPKWTKRTVPSFYTEYLNGNSKYCLYE
jgi:hypothetical protein